MQIWASWLLGCLIQAAVDTDMLGLNSASTKVDPNPLITPSCLQWVSQTLFYVRMWRSYGDIKDYLTARNGNQS